MAPSGDFTMALDRGSVTMNGREEICARLKALDPMLQVGTEWWDDTD